MGHYYYLIAGLPSLAIDDSKAPMAVQAFREEIAGALDSGDKALMDMLLLENDCRNLIALLTNGSVDTNSARGLFNPEELEELVVSVKSQDAVPAGVPSFMYDYVKEWMDGSLQGIQGFAQDVLWGRFYEYATSSNNSFVNDWFRFNLNVNNLRAAFTARKYGLDIQNMIVGDSQIAQALRTSGARDWGLSQELDYFDEVARLEDEPDLALRERKYDMLRWQWLEEHTFFNYFTVERLFVYMIQLGIVERWTLLDSERGRQLFRKFIGNLKEQTEVPQEFRIN